MKKIHWFPGTGFNRPCKAVALLAMALILNATPGLSNGFLEAADVKAANSGVASPSTEMPVASFGVSKTTAQAVSVSIGMVTASTEANPVSTEAPDKTADLSRWSLETSLTFHIVNIYMFKATYHYSERVELSIGPAFQNWKNEDKSFIDNNTYRGLELWVEYKLGYRVDLGRRFNINVQPGIGHPVWMQNKWPGIENDNHLKSILDEVIFVPQVLLGYRF